MVHTIDNEVIFGRIVNKSADSITIYDGEAEAEKELPYSKILVIEFGDPEEQRAFQREAQEEGARTYSIKLESVPTDLKSSTTTMIPGLMGSTMVPEILNGHGVYAFYFPGSSKPKIDRLSSFQLGLSSSREGGRYENTYNFRRITSSTHGYGSFRGRSIPGSALFSEYGASNETIAEVTDGAQFDQYELSYKRRNEFLDLDLDFAPFLRPIAFEYGVSLDVDYYRDSGGWGSFTRNVDPGTGLNGAIASGLSRNYTYTIQDRYVEGNLLMQAGLSYRQPFLEDHQIQGGIAYYSGGGYGSYKRTNYRIAGAGLLSFAGSDSESKLSIQTGIQGYGWNLDYRWKYDNMGIKVGYSQRVLTKNYSVRNYKSSPDTITVLEDLSTFDLTDLTEYMIDIRTPTIQSKKDDLKGLTLAFFMEI